MSDEPANPKRDLVQFLPMALIFLFLSMMDHPVISGFFWVNLIVALYCFYRVGKAVVQILRK